MEENNKSKTESDTPCIPMFIGKATRLVRLHCSEMSKKTMEDKIIHLLTNELTQ